MLRTAFLPPISLHFSSFLFLKRVLFVVVFCRFSISVISYTIFLFFAGLNVAAQFVLFTYTTYMCICVHTYTCVFQWLVLPVKR